MMGRAQAQIVVAVAVVVFAVGILLSGDEPNPGWLRFYSAAVALAEPLSARELEVLRYLAEGLSNKEIARKMAISENTIKFHVNAILGKLGAQSRTEAVVRATRAGLVLL